LLSIPTTAEQIDAWRAAKSETENLEFKEAKAQFDFETLLSYCVALANARGGILLLGIANKPPRPVVGTNAYPNIAKTAPDIRNRLHFRVDIEEVQHPQGRVLVFHIPSRPIGHPYELGGSYYTRSGESLVAMTPDELKQIFDEGRPEHLVPMAAGVVYWKQIRSNSHRI
jgi:ATP-dependent DNA helicase RecG